jgi:hypothetical protein
MFISFIELISWYWFVRFYKQQTIMTIYALNQNSNVAYK